MQATSIAAVVESGVACRGLYTPKFAARVDTLHDTACAADGNAAHATAQKKPSDLNRFTDNRVTGVAKEVDVAAIVSVLNLC